MSTVAKRNGAADCICDSLIRDCKRIQAMGFPVFHAGIRPLDSKGRGRVMAIDVPVRCGDVLVRAGDLIFADFDGVVVIPRTSRDECCGAPRKGGKESATRRELLEGARCAKCSTSTACCDTADGRRRAAAFTAAHLRSQHALEHVLVICEHASSTSTHAGQVIDPTEKTAPPPPRLVVDHFRPAVVRVHAARAAASCRWARTACACPSRARTPARAALVQAVLRRKYRRFSSPSWRRSSGCISARNGAPSLRRSR
jgi:hypothetical protein